MTDEGFLEKNVKLIFSQGNEKENDFFLKKGKKYPYSFDVKLTICITKQQKGSTFENV